jgi:hypothetical protein
LRNAARILLSAALAAGLLGVLVLWTDVSLGDLAGAWKRLPLSTYLLALSVHAGIYLLRGVRFRMLLPSTHQPRMPAMLAVTAAHNLAAYVLPAKTGELTLVVYLRALCGVPSGAGMASLIAGRLLDLSSLALAFAAASLWISIAQPQGAAALGTWILPMTFAAGAGGLVLLFASARGDWLVSFADRSARLVGVDRTRLGKRLLERGRGLAAALRAVARDGRLIPAAALSFLMWVGVFAFFSILAQGFGLPADTTQAERAFGSSLAVLTNLLPINAFAGFGTQEGGWVLGFGLLGVERELALSTGIAVHLVQLSNTVLFGAIGHVAMGLLGAAAGARAQKR